MLLRLVNEITGGIFNIRTPFNFRKRFLILVISLILRSKPYEMEQLSKHRADQFDMLSHFHFGSMFTLLFQYERPVEMYFTNYNIFNYYIQKTRFQSY